MTPDNLVAFVESLDQKHEEAHKRLRETCRDLQERVDSNYEYFRQRVEGLQNKSDQAATDITRLGGAPVNVDKIVFTPKVLAAIVVSLLSIYGFFLASTSSLKGDIHDLRTAVDAKVVTDKARADLEDIQMQALRTNVDELKRQVQLLQYDNQTLKDLARKAAR